MKRNIKKTVLAYAIVSLLLAILGSLVITNRIHLLGTDSETLKTILNLCVSMSLMFSLFTIQWWRKLNQLQHQIT
jgi:hypothetical protein